MQKVNDIYEHNWCLYNIPEAIYNRVLEAFQDWYDSMFPYNWFRYVCYIDEENIITIEKKIETIKNYIGKYVILNTSQKILHIADRDIAIQNIDELVNSSDVFDSQEEANKELNHAIKRKIIEEMVQQSKEVKNGSARAVIIKRMNNYIVSHKSKIKMLLYYNNIFQSVSEVSKLIISTDTDKTKENIKYRTKYGISKLIEQTT